MPLSSNDLKSVYPIATVTISPLRDPSGNTDKLLVTIKKMNDQDGDKKNPLPKTQSEDNPLAESTMTEKPEKVSQAIKDNANPSTSGIETGDGVPCLRHAAQNISRKAADIPSERISLCGDCSKSMLSYIFLVQDFLDSLAREISGSDSSECLQCSRQDLRNSLSSRDENFVGEGAAPTSARSQRLADSPLRGESRRLGMDDRQEKKSSKQEDEGRPRSKRTSRAKAHRPVPKREEISKSQLGPPATADEYAKPLHQQIDFLYNLSSPSSTHGHSNEAKSEDYSRDIERSITALNQYAAHHREASDKSYFSTEEKMQSVPGEDGSLHPQQCVHAYRGDGKESSAENKVCDSVFSSPRQQNQLDGDNGAATQRNNGHPQYTNSVPSPSLFSEDVDGIISTLSNVEREVYDTARNRAGWESLTEPLERLGSSSSGQIVSEAYVTSCRNNAEALGCLVLGTSLLLTRTSRTLCVLVSDGVSTSFRGPLSSIFSVVQQVRSLDPLGTTKLGLVEQPELGITFEKLNVWRLVQFNRCVYLNPDALVLQNCDELFCHEELSAVPDIGWPDCFNSGVFVFVPSVNTFWQLLEFAEKRGSYDGGDQGLLNSYFSSWSHDINKKLSFIYNLMANVSYTYTPAFNQFGRNVKIVQFHGSFKPWHVKFFTGTGQISPSSAVHPTYVQFVHIWLSIFRVSVLRLMSKEIQCYALSQKVLCAVEILRFFPLPSESEAEFYLTPPSVRLRLAEKRLQRSSHLPFPVDQLSPESEQQVRLKLQFQDPESAAEQVAECVVGGAFAKDPSPQYEEVDENQLPGSEIGDYEGMKAWEQGRMDYEGTDSSENVIKRLQFLMSRPK